MCRPRVPAACLAPECPDPPGERIPGVSYFGCSPASRAKLLATLSPREDVWPGRSARAPGPPRCTGSAAGERGQRSALSILSLCYCKRLGLRAFVGSVDLVCPGPTAPGTLPLAQRLAERLRSSLPQLDQEGSDNNAPGLNLLPPTSGSNFASSRTTHFARSTLMAVAWSSPSRSVLQS